MISIPVGQEHGNGKRRKSHMRGSLSLEEASLWISKMVLRIYKHGKRQSLNEVYFYSWKYLYSIVLRGNKWYFGDYL